MTPSTQHHIKTLREAELALLYPGLRPVPGFTLSTQTHHHILHLANQLCLKCISELEEVLAARDRSNPPTCPNCSNILKPNKKYCSPTCAVVFNAHKRRKVDPDLLKTLHLDNWQPRALTAQEFGVTLSAINANVQRLNLSRSRKKRAAICRIKGCTSPVFFFKNSKDQTCGNLCLPHKQRANRDYSKAWREKHITPSTPAHRSEVASKASKARWAKANPSPDSPESPLIDP